MQATAPERSTHTKKLSAPPFLVFDSLLLNLKPETLAPKKKHYFKAFYCIWNGPLPCHSGFCPCIFIIGSSISTQTTATDRTEPEAPYVLPTTKTHHHHHHLCNSHWEFSGLSWNRYIMGKFLCLVAG